MIGQVLTRRGDQPALFGGRYAVQAIAVAAVSAKTDFDEDQRVAFAHDQIEFTAACKDIARDQREAGRAQVGEGGGFGVVAGLLFRRT